MPGADVALGVGMHIREAGVPEKPDVLLAGDGLGMEEVMVDVRVGAKVEEGGGYGMDSYGYLVVGFHGDEWWLSGSYV